MVYIWFVIACFLSAAEILTGGFALIAFGFGGLVAALGAVAGMGLEWQICLFIASSLLFFFFIRPLLVRWNIHKKDSPQTNALGLVGKTAKVVEEIDGEKGKGRVVIDGDNFMAKSEDGSVIETEKPVEIVSLDSTILIVKNIEERY